MTNSCPAGVVYSFEVIGQTGGQPSMEHSNEQKKISCMYTCVMYMSKCVHACVCVCFHGRLFFFKEVPLWVLWAGVGGGGRVLLPLGGELGFGMGSAVVPPRCLTN